MNPYQVLGISNSAGKDEIRKAYRKLARKYHPDSNPGNKQAEDKFKEINDAYVILSDEKKKAEYDRGTATQDNRTDNNMFTKANAQKATRAARSQRKSTSNQAKKDFQMDKESIYNQFSDFFGFKM